MARPSYKVEEVLERCCLQFAHYCSAIQFLHRCIFQQFGSSSQQTALEINLPWAYTVSTQRTIALRIMVMIYFWLQEQSIYTTDGRSNKWQEVIECLAKKASAWFSQFHPKRISQIRNKGRDRQVSSPTSKTT